MTTYYVPGIGLGASGTQSYESWVLLLKTSSWQGKEEAQTNECKRRSAFLSLEQQPVGMAGTKAQGRGFSLLAFWIQYSSSTLPSGPKCILLFQATDVPLPATSLALIHLLNASPSLKTQITVPSLLESLCVSQCYSSHLVWSCKRWPIYLCLPPADELTRTCYISLCP